MENVAWSYKAFFLLYHEDGRDALQEGPTSQRPGLMHMLLMSWCETSKDTYRGLVFTDQPLFAIAKG